MKLRYYLRGLGIGIVVTALIMTIASGSEETLSDEEIKARAAQLGMVESSSLTLTEMQNVQRVTASPKPTIEPTETAKPTESEKPEETVMFEESAPQETTPPQVTIEPTKEEKPQETTAPEIDENPQETAEPERDTNSQGPTERMVQITIKSGASSDSVSEQLEDLLLVEDAGEFDKYLCDNGYSRKIRVGTYSITMNASWEEIAKIITGKP